ncbi:MAG: SDR family oxidoreductase [Fimbriimonadaceae bacterium]|nr:SDR family oxidoreductase [Fimbriimonadaceae bacterium]
MDYGIEGKVAMVAASSAGIGLATAIALAREGAHVSICGRDEARLEAAAERIPGECRSYVVDVSQAEDLEWWVEQTVEDLGQPAIVVTNTGGPPAGALPDIADAQWQAGFDSTLMNVVRLFNLTSGAMRDAQWGRFVHITSIVAKEPHDLLPISSTLRAGIQNLTRLQANSMAAHGVTVNAVLPGHTLTDRQRHLADLRASRDGISAERALELQAEAVPMRRLADPDEIAAAVTFLCSHAASYITGVNLLVDGGLTRGPG